MADSHIARLERRDLGEHRRRWSEVGRSIRDSARSSSIPEGVIEVEVLNEALVRLRGRDFRTDSSPEWKLYNILYYRYFKHLLTNEQIAARLGITSTRQFYRERKKAIKALLNVLFDVERVSTLDDA